MSISPEKVAELRGKHLEMLQGVIARIAGYNATIKNYCITLTTAVCGFAITLNRPIILLLAFLPIAVFAALDTQYLRTEKRYRALYKQIQNENPDPVPTFEMDSSAAPAVEFWSAFRSWSIAGFYLPLALGILIVFAVSYCCYG